jgi:hypothetical protein
VNTDNNYNTYNISDENPQPIKQRKYPLTPTNNVLILPSEPTPIDNDHYYTSQTSRSPFITVELALVAEYQE